MAKRVKNDQNELPGMPPMDEVAVLGNEQTSSGAQVPCISLLAATQIGHWPNQDVPLCDRHAYTMRSVAAAIGLCVSFTPAPEGSECINCKHEANQVISG